MLLFAALIVACALMAPRLFKVFELVVGVPLIGISLGGFAWSVSALIFNSLITLSTFGLFALAGVAVTMFVFSKMT